MAMDFSGVDFGLCLENLQADLAAYWATPEGAANFAASGLGDNPYLKVKTPVKDKWGRSPDDPKYGVDPKTLDTGETIEERIARMEREFKLQQAETAKEAARTDARNTLTTYLDRYGLSSLQPFLFDLISRDEINTGNPDALISKIRERPEYMERFPANAVRLKNGISELDPASYIALEKSYRDTLRANNLPDRFYDDPKADFAKWIEGDVAPSEVQRRIEQGYNAVKDADPEVKRQMFELYGVSDGELAAYFIDPERTKPLLDSKQLARQAQAANIAARASEQGGIQLTGVLAEELASRGVTSATAGQAFGQIGAMGELRQQFAGETALTTEDIIGATLGYNVAAQQELERRKKLRLGEFQGGGQFVRTQGETQGSTQIGIGKAQ